MAVIASINSSNGYSEVTQYLIEKSAGINSKRFFFYFT